MESIVLHSDIARLVLGYFVNNNLKRAALTLCRTSPHLHQEFVALRQGLQPHNFLNGGLEDIIREHVKITSMVASTLQKLPSDTRQRLQQLKLSERVGELLKLDKSTGTTSRDSACTRNANTTTQRKRRRMRGLTPLSDEEPSHSESPSSVEHISSKRPRLLAPHLYCSVERSSHVVENELLDSSTASDVTSGHTDEALHFQTGHGPKNNSTPRTASSEEAALMMPTPQTMPELTHAIMTNNDFQTKLLSNINMALQSLTVHAPTAESVNSEAVLDGLVRNILEATEKDPSFDRIIQEVVGMELSSEDPVPTAAAVVNGAVEPAPPQTPLIIRSAVASANAAAVGVNGEVSMVNGGDGNAIIQLNANNSIGTLIDPNFSISKLIVLNSNESSQKHQPASANLSFGSENLINFPDSGSALTDADAVAGGGQVCVDATNGQLTFPMFLSNEGLLSHLPFLVNNEWLAQQLRPDAFANTDVSHIEIPLPEPITVTANQLPPNSIIINSAVKQPPTHVEPPSVAPPAQLIAEQPKPVPLELSACKVSNASAVPASLDSSRLVLDRATPSTSGIVNVKAFRSLSTPRKRNSHVRTLNFSPKAVTKMQSTPLSTRRLQSQHVQRRAQLKARKEKMTEQEKAANTALEKPIIIKSVEILPSFGNAGSAAAVGTSPPAASAPTEIAAAATAVAADVSGNESNSCVPPLFAMEECSNQTVIKAVTASKKSAKLAAPVATVASLLAATPKRKQKRRVAAKACKRIISQSVAAQDEGRPESGSKPQQAEKCTSSNLDDSKENEKAQQPNVLAVQPEPGDGKEDLLAAWHRQMNSSSTDLEQRLREINAQRQETEVNKARVRRNRPVASKKKTLAQATPLASKQKKQRSPSLGARRKKQRQKQQQLLQANSAEGEFNIKITTPAKLPKKPMAVSPQMQESKDNDKPKKNKEAKAPKEPAKPEPDLKQEQQQQLQLPQIKPTPVKPETKEQPADRIPDVAILLETPFKVIVSGAGDVPPTPGPTLMPPMDTPYAKLLPTASFLFGSDTKSIIDTPMLTAITPGMRLNTPFGHALGTPHGSAAKTEYSSGSSYYRPDEAEHTDTNAQCALQPTPPREIAEEITKQSSTTCLELNAKWLPVEPTVLRRVRSFGSEAVDSIEGAAALAVNVEASLVEAPHYKLVSGLPDAVVDNSSSSSSSASSSTSSSSSSSSSSASSSSGNSNSSSNNNTSESSSEHSSQKAAAVLPARTMKLLDMESLSDISSTEDEEWMKTAAAAGARDAPPLAIDSEPAQLVSQDGEVRYPLRNWLTPSKDAAVAKSDADTSGEMAPLATLPVKTVAEASREIQVIEHAQRMLDLAKVRERVKAKVKQQTTPKARPRKTTKKLTNMRETAQLSNPNPIRANKSPKKESLKANNEKPALMTAEPAKSAPAPSKSVKAKPAPSEPAKTKSEQPEPSSSDLDPALLFALNLSAKKQQQQLPKIGRAAVEIDAQPAPSTTTGQRRGRPRKPPAAEPMRGNMRRSSRLIDNKTPAPEDQQPSSSEAAKLVKAVTTAKATKKPAKKRAEARETLATLAEAQTTQHSPELLPRQPQQQAPASGEYELDMCRSASHVANTFSFSYADNGSKPAQPVPRQPPTYFKNFQMRIMVDSEMHTVRITSPQLLHRTLASGEDNSNASSIRNIPKKRIIHFTSGSSQDQVKPIASSTPLNRHTQNEEHDDNDLEVASINTPLKGNNSEELQMEGHDAGVQIEDIESILSHLHGT